MLSGLRVGFGCEGDSVEGRWITSGISVFESDLEGCDIFSSRGLDPVWPVTPESDSGCDFSFFARCWVHTKECESIQRRIITLGPLKFFKSSFKSRYVRIFRAEDIVICFPSPLPAWTCENNLIGPVLCPIVWLLTESHLKSIHGCVIITLSLYILNPSHCSTGKISFRSLEHLLPISPNTVILDITVCMDEKNQEDAKNYCFHLILNL